MLPASGAGPYRGRGGRRRHEARWRAALPARRRLGLRLGRDAAGPGAARHRTVLIAVAGGARRRRRHPRSLQPRREAAPRCAPTSMFVIDRFAHPPPPGLDAGARLSKAGPRAKRRGWDGGRKGVARGVQPVVAVRGGWGPGGVQTASIPPPTRTKKFLGRRWNSIPAPPRCRN